MGSRERAKSAVRRLRKQARTAFSARSLYVPVGHYYSPATSEEDRRRQVERDGATPSVLPEINMAVEPQLRLAAEIASMQSQYQPKRWTAGPQNTMFGEPDARVLFGVLGQLRPNRIVEVGSGYSTAVILDSADAIGTTRDVTCIEPYTARLRSILTQTDSPTIVESPVQDVPLELFTDLKAGDLLFIDSTHVAKAGSDVLFIYLEVLPRIAPGVIVHAHDIFWPFSYRADWIEAGRDWTEAYLLRAFLTHNSDWEILFYSDWLWRHAPEVAGRIAADLTARPGSIYLRRRILEEERGRAL